MEQFRLPATSATPTPNVTGSPEASSNEVQGWRHFVGIGATDGASFWQEVHTLPLGASVQDYASGLFEFAYVSTPQGGIWRNDGAGWFQYDEMLPGEGFDPITATRLPDLLRHLIGVRAEAADEAHLGLAGYAGQLDPVDYPGVVTADGLPYTGAPLTVVVWLNDQNRLVRLEASAHNLEGPEDLAVSLLLEYGDTGPAPIPSPLASQAPPAAVDVTPAPSVSP